MTAVKTELPHGQFLPWIAAEFEMSHVTATQFMNVSERFGGQILNNLTFKPTVLYALAAPSTPETVIDKAIEKAESGEKVTVSDVKDWKAEVDIEKRRLKSARESRNSRLLPLSGIITVNIDGLLTLCIFTLTVLSYPLIFTR